MPKKMDPPPKQHHPSLVDRVTGRAKVVTFYKSGDANFKGVQLPIRKKYNFGTLLSDLDRVSDFPFGVRRIVTPSATHDVTGLEDFEDGKMYIMAPSKRKPKPLDLGGLQARPPWAHHPKSLPGSGAASSAEPEPPSPRKATGASPRNAESRGRTVKKIMVMRNGDPHSKHMILLSRNRIPSFEVFLMDVGESFQLPAQRLFTSDGMRVESLSAIFNGSEELFVVGTGVEKFRPSSYRENSPFKTPSRNRESLVRKSADESDQPPPKIVKKSKGKFRVWVATSESPVAGTDATVSIAVYGDKGKSDDLVLGCGEGRFESGNEDEFNINVGNIGDIYKIRIGHDDSTEFAGWLCEEVRLQDTHTGDEVVFPCSRWMSRAEDDGQTCRELPVIVDGSPVFPIINYYVAVVTGNYWNAGTSAKVYITVYGERGDTGPRLLHKTKRTKKFDKGKTDVFNIEAVSLGMLKKILIGHDSTEPEDSWFLEKVIVKDHKGSSLESVFPCHGWLDSTLEEDGSTSREIYVNNRQINLEKEMWEQEKWKFKPGVQLVFVSKGTGKAVQIKGDGTIEATVDPYSVQKTAIFEVQKVKANVHVLTNVANPEHSIGIDSNKISSKGKGNELKLRIQPDRSVVFETAKNSSQLLAFGQTGKPGDVRGPGLGPNRQFYCYVKGVFRDEGIVMFYTSRIQTLTVTSDGVLLATGQQSEDAYWRVHKVGESGSVRMFESLAQPESFLRIKDGHCDVQGFGDDYCHFKVLRVKDKGHVSLQSAASGDVCVGFVPDGAVKPTVDTGEDNVKLYPHVVQFGTKKLVTTPTPPISAKPAVNRKKRVLNKQTGNKPKKAATFPLTPTPTPSPPVREKSIYDENKFLEYPDTLTPTPTPCWDDGRYEELEYPYTPILTPTPTLSPDEGLWDDFYADGDWKVWVKTGRVATKAQVVLVVYGEDGVSEPFTLGKGSKDLFRANEENEFKVNVLSVGDIYKIRIGLDTPSRKAAWRLDQVKMKDMITDEQLLFKFKNRWLSAHEDDADVWRESPAIRPGTRPLPILKYSIQVTTGCEVGSSTDANVYLCLHGEKGDTGNRQLIRSNRPEKFQESQTDTFELEAVTVMTPTKVVVGHDGKGPGAGWFLGEVVVKEGKGSKTEYVFPCNRWLDEGQDDTLIERELELEEVREIQPQEWQVYVTTGSDASAGTTAMVTLVAYGDKDRTEVALIPRGEDGFQAGTTQDFRVYLGDIGQLYKIRIGHDNSAPGQDAGWYLKTVRMVDLNEGEEVAFAFDRWLSERHDDRDVWRELPAAVAGKKPLPVTRYHIQVYTAGEDNAQTDAGVYLRLWGKNGDSGRRRLVRSKSNNNNDSQTNGPMFRAGQTDVFEIEAVYLGRLLKVTAGHDGREPGQGWLLDKVVVKESRNSKNATLFPCKKWLDAGRDDGKIERDLTPAKSTSAPNPVTAAAAASRKTDGVTVSWKPPAAGTKVAGYRVTCDPPDAPASEVLIADARTTRAEFGGLAAGRAYRFDVVAINGELESDKVTLRTNAKPNPVLDAVLETTADTLAASWTQPRGELSGYNVRLSPPDAERSSLSLKDPGQTRAEFAGLTPSKKYKVDISAVSGETESAKVTAQATTKMPEIRVLKVPSAESTQATSDSLTVAWTKPEADVSGYRLALRPAEGATPEVRVDGADVTTAEFKGLSPGREYTIAVHTVYRDQESEEATITARTESQSDQPKDPTATSTLTAVSVSWTRPEGQVTGYRLLCSPAEAATSEIRLDDGETTAAEFGGLTPGRRYQVEIYARNGDAESEKTTVSQTTKPNVVLDARVDSNGTNTVNLEWSRPEGDLTGYRIDYQPVGNLQAGTQPDEKLVDEPVEEEDKPVDGNDKPVDGNDEPVDGNDKPVDGNDKPVDGNDKPVDENDRPASRDDLVKGQDKPVDAQDELVNEWEKPVSEQGKPVDGQDEPVDEQDQPVDSQDKPVDHQDKPTNDQDAEVKTKVIDSSDATRAEITGLTPGQPYRFSIVTVSAPEESESVTVNCTTTPGPILDPQIVTMAEAFTCAWSPPAGLVTGYKVACSPLSGAVEEPVGPPGPHADGGYVRTLDFGCREISVEGLDPETEYRVVIWALSGASEGPSVVLTTQTISTEKPLPALEPETNATTDSVTVRWSHPDSQRTGYRVVCRLKSPDSQNATGESKDGPASEKPEEPEESKMDAHAPSDHGNGDETAPSTDEKSTSENPGETDPSKMDGPTPSDPSNKAPPDDETAPSSGGKPASEDPRETNPAKIEEPPPTDPIDRAPPDDETAPSSDENSPAAPSPPAEGDKHVVEQKRVEADVAEVEFTGLTQMTEYVFDIYTVHNDVESEAVTLDAKTHKVKLPTQGEWKVWITTAEDSKPTQNARVHVTVYGDRDKTSPIALADEGEQSYFRASNTDEFTINVGDIGDIYKIRIGRDDDADWEGWHLTQVKMVDQHTEEELVFDFDRWMSRREDDFDVVRELPAVREHRETLPVNVYHVSVSTGDRWAAHTDANVWVVLHGERGDSGRRALYHSLKHPVKYMKGQTDEFKVEAVSLGEVSMVEIGHDGVGYGAGIFVNSVSVRESESADKESLFPCNGWLDDHMEDRQTSRQLQLLGIRPIAAETGEEELPVSPLDEADTVWKAIVCTSDLENAGTTANVYLTVFGERGRSPSRILQGPALEAYSEQEFEVDIGDIGEITKLRLEHDNSGDSPAWHVQQVRLVHPARPELVFRVDAWLSSDQGDTPSTIREVAAIRAGADPLPVVTYIVQVYVKEDPDSASTNPGLHVALIGEAGEMARRELVRTGEPVFEEGRVKVDTFSFEAVSVGRLQQAVLSIRSDERQDTWFVERVTVQQGKYATSRSVFPCKMWFGNAIIGEDGDTVLQTDLQPEGPPVVERQLAIEGEEAVPKDNEDGDEDDGESASRGNWTIWITPGKEDGMGSNSGLSVQVYGEKGRSEVIPLRPRVVEQGEGEDEETNGGAEEADVGKDLEGRFDADEEEKVDANEEEKVDADKEEKVDETRVEETEKPAEEGNQAASAGPESKDPESGPDKAEEKGDLEQDLAFPPGTTRDFDINVGEIGPIYKIRLVLEAADEEDDTPSIFLDKVKMKDKDTDQEFHFFVDRWLNRRDVADVRLPPSDAGPQDAPLEPESSREQDRKLEEKKTEDKKTEDKQTKDKSKSTRKAGMGKSKTDEKAKDEKTKAEGKREKAKVGKGETELKAAETAETDPAKETAVAETRDTTSGPSEEMAADCCLELPAIRPDVPPLPVYKYELSVRTGNKMAASLDGIIYATVHGERGDTGCRELHKSNNQEMFKQGQVDVFTLEAVDILRPTGVTVGHRSEGRGAGWYLDTVTLKQSAPSTSQYVFPCQRWLDTGVDDRKLERHLPLLGEVDCAGPATSDTTGRWQVTVRTSDQPDAGSTAKARLAVYGEKGRSFAHGLEREAFQPGTEEEFEISVGDIGAVSKIRLEHDNTGDSPAWHVSSVTMKDLDTGEELDFRVDRWLSRDDDDGQICREVPAVRNGKDSLHVHDYQVKVHTGDRENAATEGAVHITLHGSLGDSGQRLLAESNNSPKFAKGQINTFILPAVDLGKVHAVAVCNDSPDPSQALYPAKVVVKTSPSAEREFVFPAGRWVGRADAENEELRMTESNVELLLQEKWKCTVHTSDLHDCGTDTDVSLVAYGNGGMSKVMPLTNGQEGNFQAGKSAEFELEPGSYIGDVYKIRLELNDGKEKSWHLKQVDLQDCFSDESLTFEYNGWLSRSKNEGDIVAEMPALRPDEEPLSVVQYHLRVVTGEAEEAATDSEVSVTLFGQNGDSGRRLLSKPVDGEKAFDEPKKVDTFGLNAVSLGDVSRVLIHKGSGQPWLLDRLILKAGEFAGTETEFIHDGWIGDKNYPDQPTDVELVPSAKRPSHTVAPLPEGQEPVQSKGNWKVFLTTGDLENAGTEANVTLTAYGSEGATGPHLLRQDDQQRTTMVRGQTQEFRVNLGEIGQIYKVRLEHDWTNDESDWFLEKIKMKDEDTKAEIQFVPSRWLTRNKDSYVEVPAVWPETPIPEVVKYQVSIWTGDEEGAGTGANVHLTLRGERGETGRRAAAGDQGEPAAAFSRGNEDRLTIEAVSLGRLDKCIVGHDGDQPESGWFLDKIVVCESGENPTETTFPCNRWLAVDKGDNSTEVELDALPPSEGAVDNSADADAGRDREAGTPGEGEDEAGKEDGSGEGNRKTRDERDDDKDDRQ